MKSFQDLNKVSQLWKLQEKKWFLSFSRIWTQDKDEKTIQKLPNISPIVLGKSFGWTGDVLCW